MALRSGVDYILCITRLKSQVDGGQGMRSLEDLCRTGNRSAESAGHGRKSSVYLSEPRMEGDEFFAINRIVNLLGEMLGSKHELVRGRCWPLRGAKPSVIAF